MLCIELHTLEIYLHGNKLTVRQKIKLMMQNDGKLYTYQNKNKFYISIRSIQKAQIYDTRNNTKVHNRSSQASRYFGQVFCKVSLTF